MRPRSRPPTPLVGGTYANNGGNTLNLANGTRINGLSTCNIILDATGTTGAVIGNSNIGSASCGYDRVVVDNSSGLKIINNSFTHVGTNAPSGYGGIGGYMPTGLDIDGNVFVGCLVSDCIDLPYGLGAESFIRRNVFRRNARAVIEAGYAATTQPTTNLLVDSNWANDGAVAACDSSNNVCLAYSFPLNGAGSTGNTISNNYAQGTYPSGTGDICIEVSGAASVSGNQCDSYNYGAVGYSNGDCTAVETFAASNNFSATASGVVLNYQNCPASIVQIAKGISTTSLAAPPQPARMTWGGLN